MLQINKIRLVFTCISLLLFITNGKAQQKNFAYCDTPLVFRVYANNNVLIHCDTAYVLNKKLYNFLYQSNEDYKEYYSNANALIIKNDSLRNVLNEEVILTEKTYREMYDKYKILDSTSRAMVDTFNTGLNSIHADLVAANSNIDLAKKDIDAAKKDIKASFKLNNLERFAWGGGGFILGVVTTIIAKAIK